MQPTEIVERLLTGDAAHTLLEMQLACDPSRPIDPAREDTYEHSFEHEINRLPVKWYACASQGTWHGRAMFNLYAIKLVPDTLTHRYRRLGTVDGSHTPRTAQAEANRLLALAEPTWEAS